MIIFIYFCHHFCHHQVCCYLIIDFVCLFVWFSSSRLWKGKWTERTLCRCWHHILSTWWPLCAQGSDFRIAETNSGDLCPKTDTRALMNFVTTHSSGEKLCKCDQCKKTFDHSGSLKIHKLAHSAKKFHKCAQCSKSFGWASTLKVHMTIHTEEKLHKWVQCSKSFAVASRLRIHMIIHTGEKLHNCVQCGKSFNNAGKHNHVGGPVRKPHRMRGWKTLTPSPFSS